MDTVKTLAEAVNEFHKPQGSTKKGRRDDLQKEFEEIAMSLFFGGYLKCGDKKIYVREAELYYYDEDNCCNAIKDESMFHTSNPIDPSLEKLDPEDESTYLQGGILHRHKYGIDLAFENFKNKYRASVLIKSFIEADADKEPNYEVRNKKSSKELFKYIPKDIPAFEKNDLGVNWIPCHHPIEYHTISSPVTRMNIRKDTTEADTPWRYWLKWAKEKDVPHEFLF